MQEATIGFLAGHLPGKPSGPKEQATISQSSRKSTESGPKLWVTGLPGKHPCQPRLPIM